ncbi:hypothetical protein KC675_00910 [Candidatus Dojkabacteria bacterium]|jgi:uncharacterized membrane protein|uniref:Vitamin K epoxide reductase domain-containing protein n=1 Tax=Candidatus Dojkabacteria bacterium TaxID=2099670 RepID=A0A955I6Z4_9BACT|nr:hypothetical protein [Candidatus Dojkabacteria bacterium]
MPYKKTLQVILVLAIAGVLFSGYLSYYELFSPEGCTDAIVSCGDKGFTIADLPACVYGFVMYLAILILTAWSIIKNKS